MGITITATNATHSFDMGCGGFFNLRKNIALALDKELGEVYTQLGECCSDEDYAVIDKAIGDIIERRHLQDNHDDVLRFLFASDIGGEISHRTCHNIHELIKDVDFGDKGFRYAIYSHNDYEEFKDFLAECYSNRRKMRWY